MTEQVCRSRWQRVRRGLGSRPCAHRYPSLDEAFEQWDQAGRPPASGSTWGRGRWEVHGVPIPEGLPADPITRETVEAFAANVSAGDRVSQQEAFVAAMIWGFGASPYGPFTVARIMGERDFADHLDELTRVTLADGGDAAYRFAASRRRK